METTVKVALLSRGVDSRRHHHHVSAQLAVAQSFVTSDAPPFRALAADETSAHAAEAVGTWRGMIVVTSTPLRLEGDRACAQL